MTILIIEGGVGRTSLYKVLSGIVPDLLIISSMPDPPPKLSELFKVPKFEVTKKPENPFKPIPPWDRRFRRCANI